MVVATLGSGGWQSPPLTSNSGTSTHHSKSPKFSWQILNKS